MVSSVMTGRDALSPEERRRMQRVMLGVAVSIVAHTVLLFAWRGGFRPADVSAPPQPIAVRIQPPPAPPVAIPEPPPPPAPRTERPAPVKKPVTPRPVIAVPPEPSRAAGPDPFVVEQPDTPAPAETPRFDLDAAKRSARSLANLRDPAKDGTAVGQFPEKPLETETKAARLIGAAKRRNCKDGLPGGLLAPLLLLADKKDSGCKW